MQTPIRKNMVYEISPLPKYLKNDCVTITSKAAVASFKWIGKGDDKSADQAAVAAMRTAFKKVNIDGKIVIGEGERDSAPMLFVGEKVGNGGPKVDIAVDPLEGTTLCSHILPNSVSVMAVSSEGGLLNAPDVYMEKVAIGPGYPEGIIDLDNDPAINIKNLAKAKKCSVDEIVVTILKRSRHDEIIAKVREIGARIQFIQDGDILATIANTSDETYGDIYMGIGGAPEGVLSAAALKSLGGQLQGRLLFNNDLEIQRAKDIGITDTNKKYDLNDLAKGHVIFAATGVTTGWFLNGVKHNKDNTFITHSVVMDSLNGSVTKLFHTHKV